MFDTKNKNNLPSYSFIDAKNCDNLKKSIPF